MRCVDLVYTEKQCGWRDDGPVMANKVFPHRDGAYVLLTREEYDRLRAENEELQAELAECRENMCDEIESFCTSMEELQAKNTRLEEDLRLIATRCVVTLDGDLWAVVNADGSVTHLSSDFDFALDTAREEKPITPVLVDNPGRFDTEG